MEQTKLNIEWWALDQIKPYENNPRIHDHAVDKMAAVIREFGIRRLFLVRSDGELIDGHLTLKGALRAGKTHGPVLICDDLSEDQIRALRLVANKSAEWAQWDEEKLRQELQKIMAAGFDTDVIGFDEAEISELLPSGLLEVGEPDATTGERTTSIPTLKFQGWEVPLTQEELTALQDLAKAWLKDKGVMPRFRPGGAPCWFLTTLSESSGALPTTPAELTRPAFPAFAKASRP